MLVCLQFSYMFRQILCPDLMIWWCSGVGFWRTFRRWSESTWNFLRTTFPVSASRATSLLDKITCICPIGTNLQCKFHRICCRIQHISRKQSRISRHLQYGIIFFSLESVTFFQYLCMWSDMDTLHEVHVLWTSFASPTLVQKVHRDRVVFNLDKRGAQLGFRRLPASRHWISIISCIDLSPYSSLLHTLWQPSTCWNKSGLDNARFC